MKRFMTFLSDFGTRDAYVAQVKAVVLSHAPDVKIIDISHDIEPFNIISAGWLLFTSYRYFPRDTIHLAVVDPGVGTSRAILVVRKDGHIFIGPDNGIFSFLYPAEEVIEITWRPEGAVSSTFHGRDIFAPLASKILAGQGLTDIGVPKADPVSIDVGSPMVVHIDTFGNVITNIACNELGPEASITINGTMVQTKAETFAEIGEGALSLICGSASTIEISANRASAADIIGARVGMKVLVPNPF